MPTAFTLEGAPATFSTALSVTPAVHIGAIPIFRPPLDVIEVEHEAEVISLRSPQYGIPLAQRVAWMRELLAHGTPYYVGMFTGMPTRAGTGGVEASGASYARVAHSDWRDVIVGGFVARRANSGQIRFAALSGDLSVIGWGIWDTITGGTLRAFGLLRNSDGQSRIFHLASGDTPGFTDGALQVGLQ